MSTPLGQMGGYSYQSPEVRRLSGITPQSYDYRDQAKTMVKLVNDVSYMAGMQRKMQKGIDDANQNFIQQIQALINDVLVIMGGGGDLGFDWGDLKYLIQAIGLLFGWDGENVLPINLFEAAWHFFSNYIMPVDNFEEVINMIVDGIIASALDIFGEVPIAGQALQQLAQIISAIRDMLLPVANALEALLHALNFDIDDIEGISDFFGIFKPIWDAIASALNGVDLPNFVPVFNMIANFTQPMVNLIVAAIGIIAAFINMITGQGTTQDFANAIKNISLAVDPNAGGGDGLGFGDIGQGLISTILNGLISGAMDWGQLASILFGVNGITDVLGFAGVATNFLRFLGNPNFGAAGFNPITAVTSFLRNVLTPAGGLTSWTQIPEHLFGGLNKTKITLPGFEDKVFNLLPDPGFADPLLIEGGGVWTWDAKDHTGVAGSGSIKTIADGIVRQLIGVPIGTKPGNITDMGAYVSWSGVTASAGQTIRLIASAYDANDSYIPDVNNVISAVGVPTTNSVGYSGTDAVTGKPLVADTNGWIHLTGSYQAPPGTVNVRLTLEVQSNVSAGSVWFDDLLQSIRGPLDASLLGNLENIGDLLPESIGGFSGLLNIITTFQHMIDGLGSAYNPDGYVDGIDFTDLFQLAQAQTQNALNAFAQSIQNTIILGNRTNKATSTGMNPTSEGMFTAGHFSSNGSLTTVSLGAGNTIGQIFRASEDAKKGFLEIIAFGTGVTNIYANIYHIDPVTNVKDKLWGSTNLASLIPSSSGHVRILIPGDEQPEILASEDLLLEIVNNGANALNIVAKNTALPNNTNEVIQNVGFARTVAAGGVSPASLTSGQGAYSGVVPYIVIGISDVPADYHAPVTYNHTAAGVTNRVLPNWLETGDRVEVIGIGGGGGGGGSFFAITGQGGEAAAWYGWTLYVGIDILPGSTIIITVGGRGAPGQNGGNGGNGGATTIQYRNMANQLVTLTCPGGDYGGSGSNGHNPANPNQHSSGMGAQSVTFNGITYYGGAEVGNGSTGQSPGGGGGGSIPYANGASGGVGQCVLAFEQAV